MNRSRQWWLSVSLILATPLTASAIDCPVAANPAGNLLTNPGIEFCGIDGAGDDAVPVGWEMNESIVQTPENGNETLAEGAFYGHRKFTGDGGNDIGRFWNMWFKPYVGTFTVIEGVKQEDNYAHLFQDVPGTPGLQYTMVGRAAAENHFAGGVDFLNWTTGDPGAPSPDPNNFTDGRASPTDVFFALEFLDSLDTVLPGSVEIELKEEGLVNSTVGFWNDAVWKQFTLVGIAPVGTVHVRVRASMLDGVVNPSADPQSFFVDGFSLTASTPSFTPGDFDMDGDVDGADFLTWQRTPTVGTLGDWQTHYGTPLTAAVAAVPEPGSCAGLVMLVAGRMLCRRRGMAHAA